jgi:hypothetical protein
MSYLGRPYGAKQRGGPDLDCSGFVRQVFAGFGIRLPATSRQQARCGIHVARDALRAGDLVFFSSPTSGKGRIGHVGLVIDVESGRRTWIVHSSTHGIRIDSLVRAGLGNRFLEARRILTSQPPGSPGEFGPDVVDGAQADPFRSRTESVPSGKSSGVDIPDRILDVSLRG